MTKNEKSLKISILGDDEGDNEKLREKYIKDNNPTNKGEGKGIMITKLIQNIQYKLTFFEFSEKDKDDRIIPSIQDSQALFIQFDLRDRESFTNLYDNWIIWLRDYCKYEGLIVILGNYKNNDSSDTITEDEIDNMIRVSDVTVKYVKIAEMSDEELKEKFDELMKDADEHDMRREKNDDQRGGSLKKCIVF